MGVMVADRWVDCVLEVKRVNDRIMTVRVSVGKWVIKLVSVYAPQVGRPLEEKESFYLALGKTAGFGRQKWGDGSGVWRLQWACEGRD